jgi:uncharacterized membrane protein
MATPSILNSGPRTNPSNWSSRLPVFVLALLGCGIATYLALYQLDVIGPVWEPFFGNGSHKILKESSVAHLLPIPDAALGAVVYLLEAVSECIGGQNRWRTLPMAVFVTGVLAAALGLTAIGLVLCQVLVFQAYCTLCLASATCSLVIAGLAWPEVAAALRFGRRQGAGL